MDVRTTKPIATISYNTRDHLKNVLEDLRKRQILQFWAFIWHQNEDDECRKNHIHLYMEPAQLLQTLDLEQAFIEIDIRNPNKPLKCIQIENSKWVDWYLYAIHDRKYLAYKKQSRVYHYNYEDIVCSDEDTLYAKVHTMDLSFLVGYEKLEEAVDNGLTFYEYSKFNGVPIEKIQSHKIAFDMLLSNIVNRNGRKGHEVPEEDDDVHNVVEKILAGEET